MEAFVAPIMLGGGAVDMLSNLIYDRYMNTMNYPYGSTMGIILLVISLSIVFGLQRILMRYVRV
jgi:ABC-type spermidine/putrescine transport system permease subunit I